MEVFDLSNIAGVIRMMALNAAKRVQHTFGNTKQSTYKNLLEEVLAYYSTVACNEIGLKLNDTSYETAILIVATSLLKDLRQHDLNSIVTPSGCVTDYEQTLAADIVNS